jgi:DNA polymerase III subunit epsilon
MYLPNFLDGFDRLVAFDAETTGKRTPDAEFIRKQPFAWRAPHMGMFPSRGRFTRA